MIPPPYAHAHFFRRGADKHVARLALGRDGGERVPVGRRGVHLSQAKRGFALALNNTDRGRCMWITS